MKFISTLLMFFGYVLLYSATAAGGKFATDPWVSLYADAYTEARVDQGYAQIQSALAAAGSPSSSVVASRVSAAVKSHPGYVNVPPGTPGAIYDPVLGWIAKFTTPAGIPTTP